MHYSLELLGFSTKTYSSHHHLTIAEWQVLQVEKFGIKDGYIYEQVNEYYNDMKRRENYQTASEYGIKKGIIWCETGMGIIDKL